MASFQLLDILLIATVAGIVLFRLYTVLGRRTGHERPPPEKYQLTGNAQAADDTAGVADDRKAALARLAARPSDAVASGLVDIKLADRSFDRDRFVAGARAAYEMIVTAFAGGDRAILRPLLSEEVFATFDSVIGGREQRGEKVEFAFVGFKEVKIVSAALKGRQAEITLAFSAQFISATSDAHGKLLEGDGKTVREMTDIWTFARNARARDPNWTLVATSSEPS